MENNENDDKKRKIQLEIRLKIALIGLMGFGGALAIFLIKRIIEILIK